MLLKLLTECIGTFCTSICHGLAPLPPMWSSCPSLLSGEDPREGGGASGQPTGPQRVKVIGGQAVPFFGEQGTWKDSG